MATGQSIVFKTPHSEHLTRDRRWRLSDVCLSTSAAPIYLPLAAISDPDVPGREMILADGGLWANNPVLIGLIEALLMAKAAQDIQVLSISTCPTTPGSVADAATRHWGLWRWRGGTTALNVSLESQSWGHHYMASKLADALRAHGRDCHVIRVPHTAPSPEQARYLGLDRASPDSLRILIELGRRDSDLELALPFWSPGVSMMLTDMFLDMPERADVSRPHSDRRASERISRNLALGAGVMLKDQSAAGARLLIEGAMPKLGSLVSYSMDTGPLTGIVKWTQQLEGSLVLMGVELVDAPASVA
jgi:hypothetical protein